MSNETQPLYPAPCSAPYVEINGVRVYSDPFAWEAEMNQARMEKDEGKQDLLRRSVVDFPCFRARLKRTGKRPLYSLDLSCEDVDMLRQEILVGEDLRDVFAELLDFLSKGVVSHAVLRVGVHSLPNKLITHSHEN